MTSTVDQAVNEAASTLVLIQQRALCQQQQPNSTMAAVYPLAMNSTKEDKKRTLPFCNHKLVDEPSPRFAKRRRTGKGTKSVRFAPPSDQDLHSSKAHDKATPEEAKDVWWTPEELAHIHRRERSMVQVLARLCIPFVQRLDRLVELSGSEECIDDEEASMWISSSDGRGLEPEVMHILDDKNHNAKRIVRKVLYIQNKLREYGDSVGSPELRDELLRTKYAMLSQRQVRMAQLLASGDAMVAQL